MFSNRIISIAAAILPLVGVNRLCAQSGGPFDLSWNTIDGGGQTFSTGGQSSLGGTIGQCDAGTMSGGQFSLTGGFWGVTSPSGTGVPPATATTAALRKSHDAMGAGDIPVNVGGAVENQNVTSEPRSGGITELRIAFDVPPGTPGANPVSIEEQACAGCPCTGSQAAYVPYAGSAAVAAEIAGNELILTFTPGLENARTYKLTFGPEVTSIEGQSVEVRGLLGDADSSGRTNAVDRSIIVGAWTSPSPYSAPTDIDLSGATNAVDRSIAVGAWTGTQSCAP